VDEQPISNASSSAFVLAALGGLLAVVGALLEWFTVTGLRPSEIFGEEIVATRALAGTSHVTGVLAVAAGASVALVALVAVFLPPRVHRTAAWVTLVAGLVVIAVSAIGYLGAEGVAEGADLPRVFAALDVEARGAAAVGPIISAIGGLLAATGGMVAARAWRP
jgi:hypothetical protein